MRAYIDAVVHALLEAVLLVVLVVILFLQTRRASMIPLLAVPVSIIGTFAVLYLYGFSMTLFGLVLAIGIVVDDAIVVVENVERNIEAGLSPRDATYRAMRGISRSIIAIALVLIAVFVPFAFISGLSGQFYKQFAVTIAISTVISAVNSLTLSPALSALLLKGHDEPKDRLTGAIDRYRLPLRAARRLKYGADNACVKRGDGGRDAPGGSGERPARFACWPTAPCQTGRPTRPGLQGGGRLWCSPGFCTAHAANFSRYSAGVR